MDGSLVIVEAFIIGCALTPFVWCFGFEVSKKTMLMSIGVIIGTLLSFNVSWAAGISVIFLVMACLTLDNNVRTINKNKPPEQG